MINDHVVMRKKNSKYLFNNQFYEIDFNIFNFLGDHADKMELVWLPAAEIRISTKSLEMKEPVPPLKSA